VLGSHRTPRAGDDDFFALLDASEQLRVVTGQGFSRRDAEAAEAKAIFQSLRCELCTSPSPLRPYGVLRLDAAFPSEYAGGTARAREDSEISGHTKGKAVSSYRTPKALRLKWRAGIIAR
jgi:hypothetical protein